MPAPDYSTEIAQLETALASGELTVETNGDRVTYSSAADIRERIQYFTDRAGSAATVPGGAPSNVTLAAFCRD